jgi:hypothetical protein
MRTRSRGAAWEALPEAGRSTPLQTKRFHVVEVSGYSIVRHGGSAGGREAVSYSVVDSCDCYREVFTRYARQGLHGKVGRAEAYSECERLNALEEALSPV